MQTEIYCELEINKVSNTIPIRILHVDDDSSMLEISKQILMDMESNFEIDHACCVDETCKKLATGHYDVVISDYEMPQKNGLAFLREIRQQRNGIPFVLFTGKGREDVAVAALNLGADGYYNKQGSTETVYRELVHGIRQSVQRKKSEEALRETEEYLDNLLNYANAPIIVWDNNRKITLFNNAFAVLTGYSKESMLGSKIDVLFPPAQKEQILQTIKSASKGQMWQSVEIPILCANKEVKVALWNSANITDKEGNIAATIAQGQDITERKQAEEDLRISEEKYRTMVEASNDWIWTLDKEGNFTYFNKKAEEATGYELKKWIGKSFSPMISPTHFERIQNVFCEVSKGKPVNYEVDVYGQDGSIHTLFVNTVPLYSGSDIAGTISFGQDITECKIAEEKIKRVSEEWSKAFDAILDFVFVLDKDHRFVIANRAICDFLNKKPEELIGKYCYEVLHGINEPLPNCPCKEMAVTGKTVNMEVDDPRSRRSFLLTVSPLFDDKGEHAGCVHIVHDITQRRKKDQVLMESEEKYRKLFEVSMDAVFVADAETGMLLDCNVAAQKLVGREKEEIVGKHQRILHPEGEIEGEFTRVFKQHLNKEEGMILGSKVITKTGEIRDVSIKANLLEFGKRKMLQGVFRDITEQEKAKSVLLATEEKYRETIVNANVGIIAYRPEGEVTILNPKMEKITGFTFEEVPTLTEWFENLYPNTEGRQKIKDKWFKKLAEEGEVKEGHAIVTTKEGERRSFLFNGFRLNSGDFIAFAQDITERKNAEEKLKANRCEMEILNEKLRVVGGLTRHDVRNKLAAIKGNVYLLRQRARAEPELTKFIDGIDSAVDLANKLFEFSSIYEKIGTEQIIPVKVEDCFNEAFALFPKIDKVKISNDCKDLEVMSDSLLRQLFYNLIDNSLKYGGEKLTQIRLHYSKGESGIKMFYEDNGVGIPEANKSKLFTEGFTTGNGSGLGLKLIKKMMAVYGWTITETGKAGKGAKFTITIPRLNNNGKENYQIAQ